MDKTCHLKWPGIFWAMIVLGWIARIANPLIENPLSLQYSDMSRHWRNGEILWTHPGYPSAIDPLGFQLFLHILQWITQENSTLVGLSFGVLSVSFTWFFYRAARDLGLARKASAIFLLILVWTPSVFTIFHFTVAETLTLTVLGFSVWMTARGIKKPSWIRFAVTVSAWSIACQVKSTLLPVALISCFFVWIKLDRKVLNGALASAIFVLLITPNIIRTKYVMGYGAPFGSSWGVRLQLESKCRQMKINWGTGKYSFASPSMSVEPLWPLSRWSTSRNVMRTTYTIAVNPVYGERDWQEAEKKITYTWKDALNDRFENTIFLLFSPSWPEYNFGSIEGWINYLSRWMWGPLIFYMVTNNFKAFFAGRFEYIPVITTVFFLFLLFQNVTIMEGRYRKPLEPLLLFNAALIFANQSVAGRETKRLPQLIDESKASNPS